MKSKRGIVLITGLVVLLFMGLIYAWSIFVGPLEDEFGWARSQTSMTFSISMLGFSIGGISAGYIKKKSSNRVVIALGTVLIVLGFVFSSQMNSLWQLFVFYGILSGVGVGLCYNTWLGYTLKVYEDKTGTASGILLLGFGLGGFVLGKFASYMLYADSIGWRKAFFIIGIIILAVGALSLLVIDNRKISGETAAADAPAISPANSNPSSPTKLLKNGLFWIYIFWCWTLLGLGLAVIGQAAMLAVDMGASQAFAATAVGLLSIGNGAARVVLGIIFDKKGRRSAAAAATVLTFAGVVILLIAYHFSSLAIGIIALFLCGFGYGAISAVNPACTRELFGNESFQQNYGLVFVCSCPAIFIGNSLSGVIKASTGSYQPFLILAVIIGVISLLLLRKINQHD